MSSVHDLFRAVTGMCLPSVSEGVRRRAHRCLGVAAVLAGFCVMSAACKRASSPSPTSAAPAEDSQAPRSLRLLWRLPGMETSHSLLSGNPAGRILLALKQTGNHAWDLCAIEVRKGKVSWCSPLSRRADVALSVVGDKAIAHDPAGYIFAYDLGTGHRAWNTKLDCEIGPGHLRAVGAETAVETCARPSMASVDAWKVDLVAIDLKTGEVRWRNAQASQWGRFYLDGEKLIAYFSSPDRSIVPLAKPRLGSRKARSVDRGGVAPRVKRDWNALVGSRLSQWTVLDALTGKTLPRAVLSGAVSSAADAAGDVSVVVSPLFSEDVAFASAFCSWLERSALPEAKTVMAEHDRAMNAPGAWKALCESNSF